MVSFDKDVPVIVNTLLIYHNKAKNSINIWKRRKFCKYLSVKAEIERLIKKMKLEVRRNMLEKRSKNDYYRTKVVLAKGIYMLTETF